MTIGHQTVLPQIFYIMYFTQKGNYESLLILVHFLESGFYTTFFDAASADDFSSSVLEVSNCAAIFSGLPNVMYLCGTSLLTIILSLLDHVVIYFSISSA